jgi:hypothetical protein
VNSPAYKHKEEINNITPTKKYNIIFLSNGKNPIKEDGFLGSGMKPKPSGIPSKYVLGGGTPKP